MTESNQDPNKKIDIMDKLLAGIKDTMNGENFKEFLKCQSQFHNYSFNNAILIYTQNPTATRVAGFETWKKLGRYVNKGEKGIQILRPEIYKFNKDVQVVDPISKKTVVDPATNKPQTVSQEYKGIKFVPAYVFDVSQTNGKELPTICKLLQGDNINSDMIIRAIRQSSNVPINFQKIEGEAKGYYMRGDNEHIVVREGMSLDQSAKTLIHEYGHSKLHRDEPHSSLERQFKEFEAESVAFIVSDNFGVDTSEYSFDYLASWTNGLDLDQLKPHFKRIQETADAIINDVETVLNKELAMNYSPARIVIEVSENEWIKSGTLFNFDDLNSLINDECENQKEKIIKADLELRLADGTTTKLNFDSSKHNDLYDSFKVNTGIDVQQYIQNYSNEPKILSLNKDVNPTTQLGISGTVEINGINYEFVQSEVSGDIFPSGINDPEDFGITVDEFSNLVSTAISKYNEVSEFNIISADMVKSIENPFDKPLPHPFNENDAFSLALQERTNYVKDLISDSKVIKLGNASSSDFVILHPSTKDGSNYQLTYFVDDKPFSDAQFDTMDEVVERLVDTGFGHKLDEVPSEISRPEGYSWDGVKKISFDTAMDLMETDQSVLLLYDNDTEAYAESCDQLIEHNDIGGEFGDDLEGYSRYKEHLSQSKPDVMAIGTEIEKKSMNPKELVIAHYEPEFKSIKHISLKTAKLIEEFNESHGKTISIKQLKRIHLELGRKIESDPSLLSSVGEKFNKLNEIVSDLKHAQLAEKKVLAHEKALQKQATKSFVPEMS